MDFLTMAKDCRYSCRRYADRPLEKETLERILEAGRVAPTATNAQPQRIVAVTTPEGMESLAGCTRYTFGAPAALIVCYDRTEVWVRSYDGKEGGDVDAAIVTTHMMLQAAELGVGTCWVGSFDPKLVREEFSLPAQIVPVAILILGWPADEAVPSPKHDKRKPLEETVVYGKF
ncbi:MAG: nitroreductase family protein [Lachnospiraceae bacterium]|nr:nitroreductase family protein [Lachnospiraceae bacterium]